MRGNPAKKSSRRLRSIAIASAVLAGASAAQAQVATMSKGHQLLVNNGLQIWGLVTDANYQFNYPNMAAANFNAVTWSYGASSPQLLSAGQKWGKWVDYTGHPSTALNATEQAHISDLVTLQVGDEQQGDLESPTSLTTQWFQAAHAGNYFPNQLLYVNSFFINSDNAYGNFIANANPDAISWDGYPFSVPAGTLITPQNWLTLVNRFRRHGLGSYIGATGNSARPYGMYLQTYHGGDGARDPGDVEMRWQQFTAWTAGYTFVDTFTAGGGNTSLFVSGNQNLPNEPIYSQFKETARQGRNLGPALTRLISYGYGPSVVVGKNSASVPNAVPNEWLAFNQTNAPPNQQYLTSLSAANVGSKNNGQPGDVYVGFFNPLHASFGDPAGEVYFMVTNGLGAYLDDPTATVAQCAQNVTMNFDTQYSGVSTLQRLRRSDGQLEIVPLTRTSARLYSTTVNLEGGTGDLFKYNDGTPFVGWNNKLYWDNDANAAGNNTSTGANMGGGGTWDGASSKWHNGSSNGAWAGNRDAILWGTAGTVTLSVPQSINSLAFKTSGYTVTGSTLTMAGQWITTDSGVTATISSTLAGTGGIVKAGAGTLLIGSSNSYTGGTAVNGGVLQISADAAMGPAPVSFTTANIILNGGTLRFGANLDINNNRGIDIGPAGGTIDTQGFTNPSGYNATAGGFRGPGDLTKMGSGTFFAAATTGGANTTWKGKLIIKQGIWKIVASDGLPYNVLLADGLQPAQVTLDGGTWQVGATINVMNGRRGITVAAGGGTIDTPGFDLTWAGPMAGSITSANLNKTGSGILRFTGASGTPSTYNGNVNISAGTLRLDAGITMGDLASINLANAAGATLNVTGAETIGSLSGGGTSGGNVTLSAITLTTGGNNASTTFGGVISGSGASLTKVGSGTMTLSNVNTYTGATTVNGGTLAFNQSHTSSASLIVGNGATARVSQNGTRAIKTGSVSFSGTGKLDLKDNKAIVTSQPGGIGTLSGATYSGVTGLIQSGRGDGTWNGNGITTSMTDATTGVLTTLAVATAGETGYAGGTFMGVSVNSSDVLVMYTWGGDADLNGELNGDDYFYIDSSILSQTPGFHNGDFDYNGVIDGDDYFILDSNILQAQASAPFPTASTGSLQARAGAGGYASVPEPAGLGGLIALAALGSRRRKRR